MSCAIALATSTAVSFARTVWNQLSDEPTSTLQVSPAFDGPVSASVEVVPAALVAAPVGVTEAVTLERTTVNFAVPVTYAAVSPLRSPAIAEAIALSVEPLSLWPSTLNVSPVLAEPPSVTSVALGLVGAGPRRVRTIEICVVPGPLILRTPLVFVIVNVDAVTKSAAVLPVRCWVDEPCVRSIETVGPPAIVGKVKVPLSAIEVDSTSLTVATVAWPFAPTIVSVPPLWATVYEDGIRPRICVAASVGLVGAVSGE